jgi:hypothetical protein
MLAGDTWHSGLQDYHHLILEPLRLGRIADVLPRCQPYRQNKTFNRDRLTIVTTNCTSQIFLEIFARVVLFVLLAESEEHIRMKSAKQLNELTCIDFGPRARHSHLLQL